MVEGRGIISHNSHVTTKTAIVEKVLFVRSIILECVNLVKFLKELVIRKVFRMVGTMGRSILSLVLSSRSCITPIFLYRSLQLRNVL